MQIIRGSFFYIGQIVNGSRYLALGQFKYFPFVNFLNSFQIALSYPANGTS